MKFLTFDESGDIPFYNNNPRISKKGWVALFALLFSCLIISLSVPELIGSLVFCFGLLIPILYFARWDYSLLFHKPTKDELKLAVLMFIGYIVYAMAISLVLDYFGLAGITDDSPIATTVISFVSMFFSLMGEELLKFIPFVFLMRVVYKFSKNRNLAISISSVFVMISFGLIHYYPPYNTIISVILLQGLGTIFEIYGYLKTKNLFVPYISHLLTDMFVLVVTLVGI